MLESDSRGFLVGQPFDMDEESDNQLDILKEIQNDISSIRTLLAGRGRELLKPLSEIAKAAKDEQKQPVLVSIAMPGREGDRLAPLLPLGDALAKATTESVGVVNPVAIKPTTPAEVTSPAEIMPAVPTGVVHTKAPDSNTTTAAPGPVRGADGRFVGSNGAKEDEQPGEFAIAGAIGRLTDGVGRFVEAVSPGEGVDPSVAMLKEIAAPVSAVSGIFKSGFGSVWHGESKWYKRIFRELRIFRQDAGEAAADSQDTLEEIEKKTGAPSEKGGGLLSFIGRGLGGILGRGGVLARLASPILGLLKYAKKIPVLGGLAAGALGIFDWFSTEGNDSLTRREKDEEHGRSVGGLAGMLGGAAAGAAAGAILGPIGIAVGGVVGGLLGDKAGQVIGEYVGGWVNDLRAYDIPGKIQSGWSIVVTRWDSLTTVASDKWQAISERWGKAIAYIEEFWKEASDKISEIMAGFANAIESLTGIDLPTFSDAKEATFETINEGMLYISNETAVGRGFTSFVDSVQGLWSDAPAEQPITPSGDTNPPRPSRTTAPSHTIIPVTHPLPKLAPKTKPTQPSTAIPSIKTTVGSNKERPINVTVAVPDVGQDTRDRNIANIATGGLAK